MKVSRFYPGFLKSYYGENHQITQTSYIKQYEHLMSQGFGWADHMSRALMALGVECLDVVANAEPLQNTWAKENGSRSAGAALVLEQIQKFKPDVLFIQDTVTLDTYWCSRIRESIPTIKALVGWQCAPYSAADLEHFKLLDLLLTCNPRLLEEFNAAGLNSKFMHHCFEPTLYAQYANAGSYTHRDQVLFAGSVVLGRGYHDGRLTFLNDLSVAGVPLLIHGEKPSVLKGAAKSVLGRIAQAIKFLPGLEHLKSRSAFSRALQWKEIELFPKELRQLGPHWKPPLYAKNLLSKIFQTPINLNFHIDSSGDFAGNARLFEVTGMGSCLVTDHKKNISSLFEPDKEIVTYSSTAECIEKIRWLFDHPVERARIAEAGRIRCHKDHSFAVRAQVLNELIKSTLKA